MTRYRDEPYTDRVSDRWQSGRWPMAFGGMLGRGRMAMAIIMATLAFFAYAGSPRQQAIDPNAHPIELGPQHEIALGRKSFQQIESAHGGLTTNLDLQTTVDQIGRQLVVQNGLDQTPYKFSFRVLADPQMINAFAVPGGYIYVTTGLISQLESNDEIAAILAHQISHVLRRHGLAGLANRELSEGHTGATVLAGFVEPSIAERIPSAAIEQLIQATIRLDYEQNDENRADQDGIQLMARAGFNPTAMIRAIKKVQYTPDLARKTDFVDTHPNSEGRLQRITEQISRMDPDGIPDTLID